jgi:RNA polymerase sigma-70 factor, ECF subfamily
MRKVSMQTNAEIRFIADGLLATGSKDRFCAKRTLEDDSPRMQNTLTRAISRARAGDEEAVRYLYIRYADNVYGYVASIVRDEHEAEDITQQVFAKLITAIGRYEQRQVPFSSWLLRLARNAALDHLRRRIATPIEDLRSQSEHADEAELSVMHPVGEALAALPADQRTVVVLRHVVGLSPGEIARCLGRTENSIHGLHHRGRRALQTNLRSMHCGPTTASAAVRARRDGSPPVAAAGH